MAKFCCPECHAEEMHHTCKAINIRTDKVRIDGDWMSQCLVCSGGYNKVDGEFTEANHDPDKGWFVTVKGLK